jgi:hypothetical protein
MATPSHTSLYVTITSGERYVSLANILDVFRRRVVSSVRRGPWHERPWENLTRRQRRRWRRLYASH